MADFSESMTAVTLGSLQNDDGIGAEVDVRVGIAVNATAVGAAVSVAINVEVAEGREGSVGVESVIAVAVGVGGVEAGRLHPVNRMNTIHANNFLYMRFSFTQL